MTDDIRRRQAIGDLRRDAVEVDKAADILYRRGAMKLAEQLRKKVAEWQTQLDEMRKRAG